MKEKETGIGDKVVQGYLTPKRNKIQQKSREI